VNDPNGTAVNNRRMDADLIRRAQQGDSEAFATLFHSHKTRIYSLCFRMTNNAAEAEDLAQDAFLQVFRKLSTFRGDSALSTWLYRIAVNTVLMHFRRKTPCRISLDEPIRSQDDSKSVRREYGTRDGRLDSAVTRVALTRAISELPEGYRAIFLLHEVDGYQHREIAKLLGCSVGNSKSQLHKAKLKIRDFLSQVPDAQVALLPAISNKQTESRLKGKNNARPRAFNPNLWETTIPAISPAGVPAVGELASSTAA
jgi:RNA polymerase sigma-70 factor (ECF subfamily)